MSCSNVATTDQVCENGMVERYIRKKKLLRKSDKNNEKHEDRREQKRREK
jgi:hypothetical protein